MEQTKSIAKWIYKTKFENIPSRIIKEAKIQIINIFATLYAGYKMDSAKKIMKTISSFESNKECTIIPSGKKTSLHNAIFANTALSMSLDYDDYLLFGHTGHSSVLVPLALSEIKNINGKDFLNSLIIGNEIGARIGGAIVLGPLNGQMWSFLHSIISSSITSKLLNFSFEEILSAISISLTFPIYPITAGFMGSEAKLLTASFSSMNGVISAQLAKNNFIGSNYIIEDEKGFLESFAISPLPFFMENLGKVWFSETLSYKIYPGCAYISSIIDCILKILSEEKINYKEIKEIQVHTNILTFKMENMSKPYLNRTKTCAITLNFSVPYNVAICLIDKKLTPAQFTKRRICDKEVWQLAEKVKIYHDLKLTKKLLQSFSKILDIKKILKEINLEAFLFLGKELNLKTYFTKFDIKEVLSGLGEISKNILVNKKEFDFKNFEMNFPSRVVIKMQNGKKYEGEQDVPLGAAGYSIEEKLKVVEEKFYKETRGFINKNNAEKILKMIKNMEKLKSQHLRELIRMLCRKE